MNLLINADARQIPLADGSVNCIVTSPPYYGLRNYQVDEQIGLEQTPQEYIDNLVQVFRECWRILRDDGNAWIVIGDSYVSNTGDRSKVGGFQANPDKDRLLAESAMSFNKKSGNLKSKDLIGIPWMVAFALRDDGWYLRQDIIWHKPNPMPESVKDRCTKAHEYVFLLSKLPNYYYDYEAVLEPATGYDGRKDTKFKGSIKSYDGVMPGGKPQTFAQNGHERWQYKNLQDDGQQPNTMHLKRLEGEEYMSPVRNRRSVWTVPTSPYKGAHFATYPPELIEPCILAGCPELICSKCGAPWVRDLEREDKRHWTERNEYSKDGKYEFEYLKTKSPNQVGRNDAQASYKSPKFIDHGLKPTCNCGAEPISGVVFDPFAGSGTTVAVANSLGRRGIGIDLNYNYLQLAQERVGKVQLPLV